MTGECEPEDQIHQGGCECGGLRYEVRGPLRPALVCHCGMCQRIHSSPAHYSAAKNDDLHLLKSETLTWYHSSEAAARGFCSVCGASLFWRPTAGSYTAISCGSLERPSGVEVVAHMFLEDQGDYYALHDDLPRFQRGSGGKLSGVATAVPE